MCLLTLCVQTDIYSEWRDYYLDYNKLKKVLKEGTMYSTWNAQREKQFLELLEKELEKIQGFQQSKVCNEFPPSRAPPTDRVNDRHRNLLGVSKKQRMK